MTSVYKLEVFHTVTCTCWNCSHKLGKLKILLTKAATYLPLARSVPYIYVCSHVQCDQAYAGQYPLETTYFLLDSQRGDSDVHQLRDTVHKLLNSATKDQAPPLQREAAGC